MGGHPSFLSREVKGWKREGGAKIMEGTLERGRTRLVLAGTPVWLS